MDCGSQPLQRVLQARVSGAVGCLIHPGEVLVGGEGDSSRKLPALILGFSPLRNHEDDQVAIVNRGDSVLGAPRNPHGLDPIGLQIREFVLNRVGSSRRQAELTPRHQVDLIFCRDIPSKGREQLQILAHLSPAFQTLPHNSLSSMNLVDPQYRGASDQKG
jgi:hypothetical protein